MRQIFYRLVSDGVVAKTETAYKSTVVRLLTAMRREGALPFRWIADNTRWMRKSQSFDSVEDALFRTAQTYRRALWASQDAYVEVWLETEQTAAIDKPCFLYYFGDHDPSGVDIPRRVEIDLRSLAPAADITFERLAVTPAQIAAWDLPTRPTKRRDSRSKTFAGESVEVDAIPPDLLRALVTEAILQHLDERALDVLRVAEESERELLYALAATQAA